MTDMNKIVDRIRKLLALANNNMNENEAAIAMKRAHRLLAEYNLSMESMSEEEKQTQDPYTKDEHYQPNFQGCAAAKSIANLIAKLYFCKMFRTVVKNGDQYTFVGRQSNVAIAKDITITVIKALRKDCAAQGGLKIPGFATSFMNGAMARIRERVTEMMAEAETGKLKDDSGANLPALLNVYKSEMDGAMAYINNDMGVKLVKSHSTLRGGQGFGANLGREMGHAAGGRVALRPTLTGKG